MTKLKVPTKCPTIALPFRCVVCHVPTANLSKVCNKHLPLPKKGASK